MKIIIENAGKITEISLCEKATKEKLKKKASVRWLVKVEWHE